MRAFYCDHFVLPLPPEHRFPMAKYRRLREAVARAELAELQVPQPATDDQLLRVHDPAYVAAVAAGQLEAAAIRRIGFPWSPQLVERSRRSVGGTIAAARAALEDGTAVNLAGGTHHAFANRGEGFCVFNDAAVAIRDLQADGSIARALIVDCDVHQGNGTSAIFADDPSVFTFSMHGRRNFPFRKERSDLDLELEDATGDEPYLALLDEALERILAQFSPDLVLYLAGADPYLGDRLGRLALTVGGLAARDARVIDGARDLGLPVAVVMGGGYAPAVDEIVAIHLETVRRAARSADRSPTGSRRSDARHRRPRSPR